MLNIITAPNKSLRKRSVEIDHNFLLSANTQQLIAEMIPAMYNDNGIGLAAPQVNHNIRLLIIGKEAINKNHNLAGQDLILINPIWEKTSRKTGWDTEGCLSVPKIYGKVKRYKNIYVKAWDQDGNELKFKATDFFACVIQHEVDHLDGILFIDKAKDIYEVE
ncbi:MAG: peptide deformylase [Candidatus Magasanikbacteria bacterium CG_4_10_14_0_2_um_filter_37_12]|uniref:Peptide deformylase n=1 Tax=Candidatus Magasanikbacteria bacterium CG_4_10_14_0_2_um_filter_37_12 TaxID=1974637 RepID=A0A2M7V7X0_9BACT|nr:MAG: peptide deformylase [Candidatus Magasanikbacteria bacterium CG_4_10_14_0_2_um_filter_37_12]